VAETVHQTDSPATLVGPGLELRPFREADISETYLGWLNGDVSRYVEFRQRGEQTPEMALEFVRSFYADQEKYMWGILPADAKHFAGTITLYNIDRIHGYGVLGLLVGDKNYWGGDTARHAVETLIAHAFGPLGLRRIKGGSYSVNLAMNFLYKRLGFRREGTQKLAYKFEGRFIDGFDWALLADDWKQ